MMGNELTQYERDRLNKEYDFFKSMCYALGYDAKFKAMCICNVTMLPKDKDFGFDLTRDEIITLVNNRREKLHEQLNSI